MASVDVRRLSGFASRLAVVAAGVVAVGLLTAPPAEAGRAAEPPTPGSVTVTPAVAHDTSGPLTSLGAGSLPDPEVLPRRVRPGGESGPVAPVSPVARAPKVPLPPMPATIENFEGVDNRSFVEPPDTNGDVGPNHYVQITNMSFAVFDKTGNQLYGPVYNNVMWGGFGGECQTHNDGDPIVQYDQLADRWLITQFAVRGAENFECVAVSATSDPMGAYHRYAFSYGTHFPDYPKLGVWPDGYYFTYNFEDPGNRGVSTCAMDRAAMLVGAAASQQCVFKKGEAGFLPSDVDGPTPPPAGSPNYVVGRDPARNDRLYLYRFAVNWADPSKSTYAGPFQIPITEVMPACKDNEGFNCVPQKDTTARLDSLGGFTMYRLAYRNFGDHESLVTNQAIAADGLPGLTRQTAVQWYELRDPATTPTLFQEGTSISADPNEFRFMASMAQDRNGNIAMGYSSSSAAMFPAINYLGRLAGDPKGTMPYEQGTIIDGGGSQTSSRGRWGDYTGTNVDPVDDCTFWHTNEYMPETSFRGWSTRVASFRMPGCTGAATVPDAPASASAVPGYASVKVSWTAPASNGGMAVTGYTVTASPGGKQCTTIVGATQDPLSCTVTGLAPGTSYTFNVTAHNALGDGARSTAGPVTPGATYVPVAPARIADTRAGSSVAFPAVKAPVPAGGTLEVPVGGVAGIPTDATAASLNVTAADASAPGFLTVYPCGQPKPGTSNVNYLRGQAVPNAVVAGLGTSGKVCVYSMTATEVIVDANGYFPVGTGFTPVAPVRVADTRPGEPVVFPASKAPLAAGATMEVPIAGGFGVPPDAGAVVLNVTAVDPAAAGFLTVYPCGTAAPNASNVNFAAGQRVANAVLSGLGGGKLCVTTSQTTDVLVDMSGWFTAPPGFTSLTPARVADTRAGAPVAFPLPKQPLVAGQVLEVPVTGGFGVPAEAGAVSLNVTATNPVAAGFLTVFPCGSAVPATSNVNYVAGQTVPNAALTGIGAGGRVCVTSPVSTDVVVDLNGWFPKNVT